MPAGSDFDSSHDIIVLQGLRRSNFVGGGIWETVSASAVICLCHNDPGRNSAIAKLSCWSASPKSWSSNGG